MKFRISCLLRATSSSENICSEQTTMISLCIGIIFAVLAESNGLGNGCEWSGCQQFAKVVGLKVCQTGVTWGMGRFIHFNSRNCGWSGRRDFCCDDECGYLACGVKADRSYIIYTSEAEEKRCPDGSLKEFVCGVGGVIPGGITRDGKNERRGFVGETHDGSGFRSSDGGNGGFRGQNSNVTNTSLPSSNGVRSNGGNGGFRASNSEDTNTSLPSSNGGRSNGGNGGFRGSNSEDTNTRTNGQRGFVGEPYK